MTARPSLRHEPHRLLFPLGAALAAVGVLPWIAFTLELPALYRPIFQSIGFRSLFHPLVEVEAALTCFAVGFLLTALPRRTGAPPAPRWLLALVVAAPLAIAACAFFDRWAVSQVVWAIEIVACAAFARSRRSGPLGRAGASPRLVWVAAAVVMGTSGAILAGLADAGGPRWFWLYDPGRDLLLQGVFLGLVLGAPEDLEAALAGAPGSRKAAPRAAWLLHGLLAAVVVSSFFAGPLVDPRLGFGLRGGAAAIAVFGLVRRPGAASGPRRSAARVAHLLLPIGLLWVAIAPSQRRAGLHVVYLGCFAALALLLTGAPRTKAEGRPQPHGRDGELALAAALLTFALIARVLIELDPVDFRMWLGVGSGALVAAAVPWAALTRR